MGSVLAWSTIERELEPHSGQTKGHKIGVRCFSSKHTVVRNKSKDWLTVSESG